MSSKEQSCSLPDRFSQLEEKLSADDGQAALSHLHAGRSVFFGTQPDCPEDVVVMQSPDGKKQLVRIGSDSSITVLKDL